MCDVESYIYLPLLEEIGYVPREKYSHAPEILAHSRAIGERFDLYRNACFQTKSPRCAGRPRRPLDRGDQPRRPDASPLRLHGQRPAAPAQAAGDSRHRDLRRHTFHTSRWDYDYTEETATAA